MSEIDFDQLRQGLPGCPSDVTLWRLHVGQAQAREAGALKSHLESCLECQRRMERWRQGFDAYPEADPARMLAEIQRRVASAPMAPRSGWMRAFRLLLAPVAVAGVAAVLLVARTHRTDHGDGVSVLHRKGGAVLHVFRDVSGTAREVGSGERFEPGDRLSFLVDTPEPLRLELIGVEASGRLYTIWPESDTTMPMSAGHGRRIPSDVELDASRGRETFYLVSCEPTVEHAECLSRGGSQAPACHAGCAPAPFILDKGS